MKRLIALATIIICQLTVSADVILNPGESFVFSFDRNDFVYQYDLPPPSPLWLPSQFSYLLTNVVHSGDTIVNFSLHEGSLATAPFLESTMTHRQGLPPRDTFILPMYSSNPDTGERNEFWPSASGAVKIEAVNNPFTIGIVTVGTVIDDKYYIASIPEPNSVVLLLIGSGVFYLRKKKRFPTNHSTLR